jgi:hypothetical protein
MRRRNGTNVEVVGEGRVGGGKTASSSFLCGDNHLVDRLGHLSR